MADQTKDQAADAARILQESRTYDLAEKRIERFEKMQEEQQKNISEFSLRIAEMGMSIKTMNHNIESLCKRLTALDTVSLDNRLKALEEWRVGTGAKLDAFFVQAAKDSASIAVLQATMTAIEHWRATMFLKVVALMTLAATVALGLSSQMHWFVK